MGSSLSRRGRRPGGAASLSRADRAEDRFVRETVDLARRSLERDEPFPPMGADLARRHWEPAPGGGARRMAVVVAVSVLLLAATLGAAGALPAGIQSAVARTAALVGLAFPEEPADRSQIGPPAGTPSEDDTTTTTVGPARTAPVKTLPALADPAPSTMLSEVPASDVAIAVTVSVTTPGPTIPTVTVPGVTVERPPRSGTGDPPADPPRAAPAGEHAPAVPPAADAPPFDVGEPRPTPHDARSASDSAAADAAVTAGA